MKPCVGHFENPADVEGIRRPQTVGFNHVADGNVIAAGDAVKSVSFFNRHIVRRFPEKAAPVLIEQPYFRMG